MRSFESEVDDSTKGLWFVATFAATVVVIASRASVSFASEFPNGMDAAHYANQVRSILETGNLLKPDLPVAYYLFALIALVLRAFGMDVSAASLLATRIGDCVIPALATVPIMLLGRQSSYGSTRGIVPSVACAFAGLMTVGMLRMISDFEKQSVAILWLALAIHLAYIFFNRPSWIAGLSVAGAVAAAALTHIGTGAATALICGLIWLASLAFSEMSNKGKSISVAAVALIAALSVSAMNLVAPHKVKFVQTGLTRVFEQPAMSTIFSGQQNRPGPGGQMGRPGQGGPFPGGIPGSEVPGEGRPPSGGFEPMGWDGSEENLGTLVRQPGQPGQGPPGGPMGGPPGGPPPNMGQGMGGPPPMFDQQAGPQGSMPPNFGGPNGNGQGGPGMGGPGMGGPGGGGPPPGGPNDNSLALMLTACGMSIAALIVLGVRWRDANGAEQTIIIGSALGGLALACPLLGIEYFTRLILIASVPAAVAASAAFALLARTSNWAYLAGLPMAASLALMFSGSGKTGMPPQMTRQKATELTSLKAKLPKEGTTLLVARHGLEYWGTYFLGVKSAKSLPADAFSAYANVIRLEETGGFGGPGGGGPRGGGPMSGGATAQTEVRTEDAKVLGNSASYQLVLLKPSK